MKVWLFMHRCRAVPDFDLGIQAPLKMAVLGLIMSRAAIRLDLAPIDAAEKKRIRRLRVTFSDPVQVRSKRDETYVFHLALA